MTKQVPWTKIIVETFVAEGCLTKDEEMILRTRASGWERTKQARELCMSIRSVDRTIARLKVKYDQVQRTNPLLPPRKESAE